MGHSKLEIDLFMLSFFSSFYKVQLANIHSNCWKERLQISNLTKVKEVCENIRFSVFSQAKFKGDTFKASEDIIVCKIH